LRTPGEDAPSFILQALESGVAEGLERAAGAYGSRDWLGVGIESTACPIFVQEFVFSNRMGPNLQKVAAEMCKICDR
jgi:hypothetical protein